MLVTLSVTSGNTKKGNLAYQIKNTKNSKHRLSLSADKIKAKFQSVSKCRMFH